MFDLDSNTDDSNYKFEIMADIYWVLIDKFDFYFINKTFNTRELEEFVKAETTEYFNTHPQHIKKLCRNENDYLLLLSEFLYGLKQIISFSCGLYTTKQNLKIAMIISSFHKSIDVLHQIHTNIMILCNATLTGDYSKYLEINFNSFLYHFNLNTDLHLTVDDIIQQYIEAHKNTLDYIENAVQQIIKIDANYKNYHPKYYLDEINHFLMLWKIYLGDFGKFEGDLLLDHQDSIKKLQSHGRRLIKYININLRPNFLTHHWIKKYKLLLLNLKNSLEYSTEWQIVELGVGNNLYKDYLAKYLDYYSQIKRKNQLAVQESKDLTECIALLVEIHRKLNFFMNEN